MNIMVSEFEEKINIAFKQIRPFLNGDGGDIELVEVLPSGDIKVRFLGNCSECDFKENTFKGGVEEIIRREVPMVKKIIQVL